MRVIDTEQRFIDHLSFQGADPDKLRETLPAEYELLYGEFLQTLHKCLKCGSLSDDNADMSEYDIDICTDCEEPRIYLEEECSGN